MSTNNLLILKEAYTLTSGQRGKCWAWYCFFREWKQDKRHTLGNLEFSLHSNTLIYLTKYEDKYAPTVQQTCITNGMSTFYQVCVYLIQSWYHVWCCTSKCKYFKFFTHVAGSVTFWEVLLKCPHNISGEVALFINDDVPCFYAKSVHCHNIQNEIITLTYGGMPTLVWNELIACLIIIKIVKVEYAKLRLIC